MSMLARLTAPLVGAALVTLVLPAVTCAQPADAPPVAAQPATARPSIAAPPVDAPPEPATMQPAAVLYAAPAHTIAPPAPMDLPALEAFAQAATQPPPPPQAPVAEAPSDQDSRTPPPQPPPPPPAPRAQREAGRGAQPRTAVAAEPPRAEREPAYVSKGVNIRIDATVTESRGDQVLGRKVVSVTLTDGENGSVRSSALVPMGTDAERDFQRVPLNMDAMVRLRDDNRVQARVTLDYNRGSVDIGASGAQKSARENFIRQSVSVILESGRPLVVAQSADPEGDRRVTLELKASVLK